MWSRCLLKGIALPHMTFVPSSVSRFVSLLYPCCFVHALWFPNCWEGGIQCATSWFQFRKSAVPNRRRARAMRPRPVGAFPATYTQKTCVGSRSAALLGATSSFHPNLSYRVLMRSGRLLDCEPPGTQHTAAALDKVLWKRRIAMHTVSTSRC